MEKAYYSNQKETSYLMRAKCEELRTRMHAHRPHSRLLASQLAGRSSVASIIIVVGRWWCIIILLGYQTEQNSSITMVIMILL
jgi:hypothetical protein